MTDIVIGTTCDSMQVFDAHTLSLRGTFSHHLSDRKHDKNAILSCQAGHDHIISASGPFFFAHSYAREQALYRTILSAPISALASDSEGLFYAAGTSKGEFTIWDASTGENLRTTSSHYKPIVALSFLDNFVISVGEDSIINIWNLGDLVDEGCRNVAPYKSIMEHTDVITSLHNCLAGQRFITSSRDRSVRMWDTITGKCTMCLFFPYAVTSCLVNPQETLLFAGCDNGSLYRVNIFPSIHTASDIIHASDGEITLDVQNAHEGPVTNLALSTDANVLFTSGADGAISKWDILTFQKLGYVSLTKNITKSLRASPVYSMHCMVRPACLFSPANLARDVISSPPMRNLQAPGSRISTPMHLSPSSDRIIATPQNIAVGAGENSDPALTKENEKLKSDNARLQSLLQNATAINEEMYRKLTGDLVGK
eukprot:Partr_v1_DN26701_c0_g1_i2_m8850 putative WD repeat domain 18